jgi:hypothetical protein
MLDPKHTDPNSPAQQSSPEKQRVKFVTNLYDEAGESYGIFGEYYFQEQDQIAVVFSIKWQFIAKVKPEIREAGKDVHEFICEDLTARVGRMKEINFV